MPVIQLYALEKKSEAPDNNASNALASLALFVPVCGLIFGFGIYNIFASQRHIREVKPSEALERLNKSAPPRTLKTWQQEHTSDATGQPSSYAEERICVICLEGIKGKDVIRVLNCNHMYHSRCFERWFTGMRTYCPLCHRMVLPADSTEDHAQYQQ